MARNNSVSVENNFIQGLITETTALRFPENAATDALNVVFDETGQITRRPKIDLEDNFGKDLITDSDVFAWTEYVWEDVSGTGELTFYVQQAGNILHFYDISTEVDIGPNKLDFTVDLETYRTDAALNVGGKPCQYDRVRGDLIVVNEYINPISIAYSRTDATITVTAITLQVRDIEGLNDTLGLTERSTDTKASLISDEPRRYYNLLNQGWFDDPLDQWDVARGDMPSNADVVSLSRSSTSDSFDNSILDTFEIPTAPAAKGKFILDVGVFDREAAVVASSYVFDATGLTRIQDTTSNNIFTGGTWNVSHNATTDYTVALGIDLGANNSKNVVEVLNIHIDAKENGGAGASDSSTDGDYTITLYGSNSAPGSETDGTVLASNTSDGSTVSITYSGGVSYRYIWLRYEVAIDAGATTAHDIDIFPVTLKTAFTGVDFSTIGTTTQEVTGMSGFTTIGGFSDGTLAFDGLTSVTSTTSSNDDATNGTADTLVDSSGLTKLFEATTTDVFDGNTSVRTISSTNLSAVGFGLDLGTARNAVKFTTGSHTVVQQVSPFANVKLFGGSNTVQVYGNNSLPSTVTDGTLLGTVNAGSTFLYNGAVAYRYIILYYQQQTVPVSGPFTQTITPATVTYATKTLDNDTYIGKDFTASGKRIKSIEVFPSTDEGFHGSGLEATIALYASNSSPSNKTNGTKLGELILSDSSTTNSQTILSDDTATSYRYVWAAFTLEHDDFSEDHDNNWYVAELKVSELAATGQSGGSDPAEEITNQRPNNVVVLNDRIFYGGINTKSLSNKIYFTQVLESSTQYGKCYQSNDPTSEGTSVLVASDGGTVRIQEMGQLVRMYNFQGNVLCFATNGVWRIHGGQGGFSATDFRIDKISDWGTRSPESFVFINGIPFWWGDEGIYKVNYNPQFDSFSVENITDQKIKDFVLGIPAQNRNFVKGVHDRFNKRVLWMYNNSTSLTDAQKYTFDSVLLMNTLTGAFYPWALTDVTEPRIKGLAYITPAIRTENSQVRFPITIPMDGSYKLLTFGELKLEDWKDWGDYVNNAGSFIDIDDHTALEDFTSNDALYYNNSNGTAAASSATKSSATNYYAGVSLGTAMAVASVGFQGSNDQGYVNGATPAITVQLYGKEGSAPSTGTDGTLLGSTSFSDSSDETGIRFINASDTTSTWDHIWIYVSQDGSAASMYLSELRVFHADTALELDYSSYCDAGYSIRGELQRFQQPNYVFVYMGEETNASAFLQSKFDFANSSTSSKWSSTQQLYNSAITGRGTRTRRLKVRGKGRAMQFRFTSESGKPFTILGWSVKDSVNADV